MPMVDRNGHKGHKRRSGFSSSLNQRVFELELLQNYLGTQACSQVGPKCVFLIFFQVVLTFFFFFFGVAVCRILVPNQGLNPGPLHWKCRILTTGVPGKSLYFLNKSQSFRTTTNPMAKDDIYWKYPNFPPSLRLQLSKWVEEDHMF